MVALRLAYPSWPSARTRHLSEKHDWADAVHFNGGFVFCRFVVGNRNYVIIIFEGTISLLISFCEPRSPPLIFTNKQFCHVLRQQTHVEEVVEGEDGSFSTACGVRQVSAGAGEGTGASKVILCDLD